MSEIASRITGLTEAQLREREFRAAASKRDVFIVPGVPLRGSIRLQAGMIVDRDDVEAKLAELKRRSKSWIRRLLPF